ncbi:maleylpyruvate isomerase N-terminal domain-containing protein [Actinomycetospora sp. NBC_00405]|uniref:maleylpyruvate isomerase N-terminal domain-containing protein n=1 Tax=Actinomycetospora sp. NBC_00405 TaxID=2975952 RepID=UPI003FA46583
MMDVDEKWQTIAGQRAVPAGVLAGLSDRDLDRPSWCARWRVRDVAAHVAVTSCSPGLGARRHRHRLGAGRGVRGAPDGTPLTQLRARLRGALPRRV